MKTKDLVFTALFMGIVFMLGLWPNLGFIEIGPISVTIIHIPVIIGAIFLGSKSGILIGLAFGIGSFMNSMTSGVLFAPVFANPLVSVLPRIIFGFVTYYIYKAVSTVIKNKTIQYGVSAGLATLTHTLMVLPLLFYFGLGQTGIKTVLENAYGGQILKFIIGVLIANGLLEMLAAILIVPIVLKALDKVRVNG